MLRIGEVAFFGVALAVAAKVRGTNVGQTGIGSRTKCKGEQEQQALRAGQHSPPPQGSQHWTSRRRKYRGMCHVNPKGHKHCCWKSSQNRR